MAFQLFAKLLFAGDRIHDAFPGMGNIGFHLTNDLFDHAFRIFDPVEEVVDVGADDVIDTFE